MNICMETISKLWTDWYNLLKYSNQEIQSFKSKLSGKPKILQSHAYSQATKTMRALLTFLQLKHLGVGAAPNHTKNPTPVKQRSCKPLFWCFSRAISTLSLSPLNMISVYFLHFKIQFFPTKKVNEANSPLVNKIFKWLLRVASDDVLFSHLLCRPVSPCTNINFLAHISPHVEGKINHKPSRVLCSLTYILHTMNLNKYTKLLLKVKNVDLRNAPYSFAKTVNTATDMDKVWLTLIC